MKPRITILTLGVDDLERALTFDRDGLGLTTRGMVGKEFEYGARDGPQLGSCGPSHIREVDAVLSGQRQRDNRARLHNDH